MSTLEERAVSQAPVLDEIVGSIADRADGRGELVRAFAERYLRRPGGFLREGEPQALGAELLGAFELVAGRGKAAVAVRAFTPSLEQHGYVTRGSVLETNIGDLPFLVDSVSAEVRSRGYGIHELIHPIIGVERDAAGRLAAITEPTQAATRDSVMHVELEERLAPEQLAELEDSVRDVLAAVRRVVEDFKQLRERLAGMGELARASGAGRPADEVQETIAFLDWLADEHCILLGARDYELTEQGLCVMAGSGLGLLRESGKSTFAEPTPLEELPPGLRERVTGKGELLLVERTNATAPVHRHERMEDIVVPRVGADGKPTGVSRLLGLFTSRAYSEPASRTPLLRLKLRQVLAAEGLIEGSHDYKAAVALFDSFPKDELFVAPAEDLRGAIVRLLAVHGDEVRLLGRRHPDGRAISMIAALPRARLTAELRQALVRRVVARYPGADVRLHEVLEEGDRVRLHISVHRADGGLPEVDFHQLQDNLIELARSWDDRARERLVARHGEERGRMLAARWEPRLPESYKAMREDLDAAVFDIEQFERLHTGGEELTVGVANEGGFTRVKLYSASGKVELSGVVPLLEHLGLRIIEERPTRLKASVGGGETWLQDFGVLGPGDQPLDLEDCGDRVADLLTAALAGEAESDSLNRLIVLAGLNTRQVAILRAYRAYRQRIGSRFTEGYQNDVIAANAALTAKQMRLFELRFDPANSGREEEADALRAEILEDLDAVTSLDHDRVLRNQLGLIEATVRTNAYMPARPVIAFKLRSADVPAIPQPPPLFEIYVHSRDVEGIHLRGGRIARGGIRWSDRQDYRTEVFGLMRAQMTKNAVIVPAGAKGGFYLRRPPADPVALRDEVRRRYVDYVGGLLDVTDNLVEGRAIHPDNVRVHDDDDTYLVVAADKGTAPLSDTANAVAQERGFWLDDAFASGGSKGYDHKALGITARGAWESLKRHFRELGQDPGRDAFTMVGIGDMSGDVFGNGLLLSDKIRLVAAYDHRHVFIDPDPDPAKSFAERKRLFEKPGSSWDDYDRALISTGGGVWPRSAKSVDLSLEAQEALGVDCASCTPTELIRAVLRAPVDVLWNGGIGTVLKASTETDADANDRASDAIRVNADELRVKIVAEGGNLGLTQRARVEFARAGGRVHADFIDNSSGVDCSDHEVNLKILLGLAVSAGELDGAGRDSALVDVTDDVCAHVLHHSYLQAQILEQESRAMTEKALAYEDLMSELEAAGRIRRKRDALPSAEELSERRRSDRGLERPELSVLLTHAKAALTDALLESPLVDDPWLVDHDLRAYFPAAIVERFGHLLTQHPLRRELVATSVANDVVDSMGPTFVSRLCAERGAEPADVVRAYRIARAVTGADQRWAAIQAADAALARERYWELMTGVDWMVEGVARWYLAEAPGAELGPAIDAARDGFVAFGKALETIGTDEWRADREQRIAEMVRDGVPEALARTCAYQAALVHAPDVLLVANTTGRPVEDVARTFALLGAELRIDWLERELLAQPSTTRSQRWALQAVLEDILRARRELGIQAVGEVDAEAPPEQIVERFLAARADAVGRLERFTATAVEGGADLPGLMLAVRHLRAIAG